MLFGLGTLNGGLLNLASQAASTCNLRVFLLRGGCKLRYLISCHFLPLWHTIGIESNIIQDQPQCWFLAKSGHLALCIIDFNGLTPRENFVGEPFLDIHRTVLAYNWEFIRCSMYRIWDASNSSANSSDYYRRRNVFIYTYPLAEEGPNSALNIVFVNGRTKTDTFLSVSP